MTILGYGGRTLSGWQGDCAVDHDQLLKQFRRAMLGIYELISMRLLPPDSQPAWNRRE